jgi:hypothetical protein
MFTVAGHNGEQDSAMSWVVSWTFVTRGVLLGFSTGGERKCLLPTNLSGAQMLRKPAGTADI